MMRPNCLSFLCIVLLSILVVPSAMTAIYDETSEEEKGILESGYIYKLWYFGRIDNLSVNENIVSFDAVNLWRFSHIRSSDGSYWDISFTHYEDVSHYLEGYEFHGLLLERLIWGQFIK